MYLPKCEHPVIIFSKKALAILDRTGKFYLDKEINYKNYHYDARTFTILADSNDERKKFRYLMPIKQYYQSNPQECDHCFVVDPLGVVVPLFSAVKCNKCSLCRESKSFDWAARCQLESENYDRLPLMVTLTYNDAHLPEEGVSKRHLQLFFDRFRKQLERNGYDGTFRYVAVSEYGSKRHRPHYHILFYGLDNKLSYYNVYQKRYVLKDVGKILLDDAWSYFDRVTEKYDSFGYTYAKFCDNSKAGSYCVKYMRKGSNHPTGKNECFFLASRRGGAIGWLGFQFHKLDVMLKRNPKAAYFGYNSRFDGKFNKICVPSYFIKKVFPSFCDVVPVSIRRDLINYQDCLVELRRRPKFVLLDTIKRKYGVSIHSKAFDLSHAIKSRLGIVDQDSQPLPLDKYGNFDNTSYCFDLWQKLSDSLPKFRSLYGKILQTDKNMDLRSLYYSSRPQQEYNIPMEVDKTYIRTRDMFESECDNE